MRNITKYNVSPGEKDRTFDGIVFDSAMEMKYYRDIIIPGKDSGIITTCERQKRYILQPSFMHNGKKIQPIEYKADFYLRYSDGKELVVDIKGCPDSVALLKRKMFWHVFPDIEYVWIGYSKADGGWVTYETIKNGRKERKKIKNKKENKE